MGGTVSSIGSAFTSVVDSVASTVVSVGSTAVSSISEVANTTISYAGSYTNTAISSISGPVLSSLTAVADTGGGIAKDYGNGIIAYNSGLVIDWSTQQVGSGLNAYLYLTEKALAIPLSLQQYANQLTPIAIRTWASTVVDSGIVTKLSDAALVSIKTSVLQFQDSTIAFADKTSGVVVYANGVVVDFATGTMGSSLDAVMLLASKGIALTAQLQQIYDNDLRAWSGDMYNFAKNMPVKSAFAIKNIMQNMAGPVIKKYALEGIVVGANGWVVDMANAAASQGMDAGLYLWRKGLEVPDILLKYIPFVPKPPLCKKCERCATCN